MILIATSAATLFLLVIDSPRPFAREDFAEMAKEHCRAEWPDDFQMQNYCVTQQAEGMQQFSDAYMKHGPKIEKALEKCVRDWTKNPFTPGALLDFQMIGYCSKMQSEALSAQER